MIYMFVFSIIMKLRWNQDNPDRIFFALNLFCGLAMHGLFAETINGCTGSIINNISFVKRTGLPAQILPLSVIVTKSVVTVISLFLVLISSIWFGYVDISLTGKTLLGLLDLGLLVIGTGLFVASVSVFTRDLAQVFNLFIMATLFTAPILYPISTIPDTFRSIVFFNPLTVPVITVRSGLIDSEYVLMNILMFSLLSKLIFCVLSIIWFQKTKDHFADLL